MGGGNLSNTPIYQSFLSHGFYATFYGFYTFSPSTRDDIVCMQVNATTFFFFFFYRGFFKNKDTTVLLFLGGL